MTGALLKAVSAGRPRQVRLLLDSGINVDSTDECGQTPLIRSIFLESRRTRLKLMKMLLRAGARVSRADIVGRNALMWACIYSRDKEIHWLIHYSDVYLDLNYSDYNGHTALYHAVTSGNAAAVRLLVEELLRYGLSTEMPDGKGVTPLIQGIELGHDVCCSILIHQGGATIGKNLFSVADVDRATKIWSGNRRYARGESDSPDDECENLGLCGLTSPRKNPNDNYKRDPSYFPPIVSQSCAKTIKFYEDRAKRLRVMTPSNADSTDLSSLCESSNGSQDAMKALGVILPDLGVDGWTARQLATVDSEFVVTSDQLLATPRTVSLTSSVEAVVDSSDDEVDDRSRPVLDGAKGTFQPTRDLHRIYHVYEQQRCSAYRPGAARPVPPQDTDSVDDSSPENSLSVTSQSRQDARNLANVTVRKTHGKTSRVHRDQNWRRLSTKSRLNARADKPAEVNSSSESDLSEKLCLPTKKNLLPKIFSRQRYDEDCTES